MKKMLPLRHGLGYQEVRVPVNSPYKNECEPCTFCDNCQSGKLVPAGCADSNRNTYWIEVPSELFGSKKEQIKALQRKLYDERMEHKKRLALITADLWKLRDEIGERQP